MSDKKEKMYAELIITIGEPDDTVTIHHMSPIDSIDDVKKFPDQIREMSFGFFDIPELPKKSPGFDPKQILIADKVNFIDD